MPRGHTGLTALSVTRPGGPRGLLVPGTRKNNLAADCLTQLCPEPGVATLTLSPLGGCIAPGDPCQSPVGVAGSFSGRTGELGDTDGSGVRTDRLCS